MTRRTAALALAVVALVGIAAVPTPTGAAVKWQPKPGLRWQYQLQGAVNTAVCATPANGGACVRPDVFVIDLYTDSGADPPARMVEPAARAMEGRRSKLHEFDGTTLNSAAVARIHARHAHAVCYVDAGTWENWRPDASRYPMKLRGKSNGWPGERWLDIRATNVLLPLIDARVQKCVKAGFDAVDFDNVDGYANASGFPLTAVQQLAFDRGLAKVAHAHGLAVGLKNDLAQASVLRANFNFAVNEQCFAFNECGVYNAWTKSGRAVVEIEYAGSTPKFCAAAKAGRRDAMRKELALRATPWVPCR